ncbi:hypothetical protein IQ249_21870 [Lusitaniella coriacea LEGE 07157]|uniref:Uncharacterized protein n=2 Tax=Lusitaniella TaxID=1983104 RepID=A0A8J7JDZ0_9CYAN|nr:hypothetical protein [Lusitaniella coriacea LEGE 07157]
MFKWVIAIDLIFALVNFYLAWKIWKFRRVLAKTALTLACIERQTRTVLYPAPRVILTGKRGTHALRERYRSLQIYLQQVQQILTILQFLPIGQRWIWQQRQRKSG